MAATIWKGHLSFGLVSIPIKLFRAARAEKIHMHRIDRATGSRVRQVFVPANAPAEDPVIASVAQNANSEKLQRVQSPGPALVESRRPAAAAAPVYDAAVQEAETQEDEVQDEKARQPVPSQSMVRGFEFEKDKYITFEAQEMEELAPKASSEMQIVEFVKMEEVDPIYLESSYYVTPDKGGEKPYALLVEALRKTGHAAIAEFTMHRRDQTVVLRVGQGTGIVAHTLYYEDEIKRENAYSTVESAVSEKELSLAIKLVEALQAKFDPLKFKDKYRERLHQAIAEKIQAGVVSEAPAAASKAAPVIDIMEALRESLQAMKKPAASESKTPVEKEAGARQPRGRKARHA